MGKEYGHLSAEERVEIYRWHASGKSARWTGEALGRHHSTISRELERNSKPTKQWPGGYEPLRAEALVRRRRQRLGRYKLARQPALRSHVRDKLAMGWSPEAISGRLALEHASTVISHEAIYRYIYQRSAQADYWHRLLRQKKHRRGWLRQPCGRPIRNIKNRVSIADRPAEVQTREQPGHWEADLLIFSRNNQSVLVAEERSSRFVCLGKPASRHAAAIGAKLHRWFKALPPALCLSLTQDNGPEFADHYKLNATLNLKTYFCDPHSPWQKGSVENMNARLRRSLPRKTDLTKLSHRAIASIARQHNGTPRKCLGFKTPKEVFDAIKLTVALQT